MRRFARATSVDELPAKPHPGRPRVLDDHADYLRERLAAGVTNTVTLCARLRERGYRGSSTTLRAYLRPARRSWLRIYQLPAYAPELNWPRRSRR